MSETLNGGRTAGRKTAGKQLKKASQSILPGEDMFQEFLSTSPESQFSRILWNWEWREKLGTSVKTTHPPHACSVLSYLPALPRVTPWQEISSHTGKGEDSHLQAGRLIIKESVFRVQDQALDRELGLSKPWSLPFSLALNYRPIRWILTDGRKQNLPPKILLTYLGHFLV